MERYDWKGDFLGFTFGGIHSSSLGIVRTSDGSRYNENLLPEFEDKIIKVAGANYTHYFGSEYKQRTFDIKIAFDNMTDKQFRQLKRLMSGQELKDLIFDEAPYKIYKAKPNGTPNLTYLAFDEDFGRVYKGEGTLQFIAYFPFARSRFKYQEDYIPKNIPEWQGTEGNKMEWLEASGLPSSNKSYTFDRVSCQLDTPQQKNNTTIYYIYIDNEGDIDTDFTLNFHYLNNTLNHTVTIQLYKNNEINSIKNLIINIPKDNTIIPGSADLNINTYNHTICWRGELRNDLIDAGDFFNIPVNDNANYIIKIQLSLANITSADQITIDYDYLYY